MSDAWDVVVLGGGMAGHSAALRASELGARVALVERDLLGGTCLNRGCIPTKAWLSAVGLLKRLRQADSMGVKVGPFEVNLPVARERVRTVVNQLRGGVDRSLEAAGVTVVRGNGRLKRLPAGGVGVAVGDDEAQILRGRAVIVATGSVPAWPPVPGLVDLGSETGRIATADQSLDISEVPPRLVIIGGGVIGVELATMYAGLGSRVTVVELTDRLVPSADAEIGELLRQALAREGVQVLTRARVEQVKPGGGCCLIELGANGEHRVLEAERVVVAVGRRPNVEGSRVSELGLCGKDGWVAVDEHMQTSLPGVYAAGDVTGKVLLAHVAARQGVVAAENALGVATKMVYDAVPTCIYTDPEVAWVGISAGEATERGYEVVVGRSSFGRNALALAAGDFEGWVEVIAERRYGEILGARIVGPHATELITQVTGLMQSECTIWEWERVIQPHPTLSEAVGEAAAAAARAAGKPGLRV